MSEVDKLVNQMAEELNSPNEYSLSTSPESNPSYILINPDRTLTVPDNLRKIGIQYDHKVESVVFKCPRYHDGIDLSTMTTIYINWVKSNSKGGKSICILDTVNPDDVYLTFTWDITQDITSERGQLTVMVCMTKTNESGTETLLQWNSELNKELYIGDGLHVSDEEILNSYEPGLVETIMKRIEEAEDTVSSYSIDIKEITSGYSITMTDNEGSETFNIFHGYASDKGATFTPTISDDGVLSWTNDKGLDNPPDINIKGPKGDRGETVYVPSVSSEGVLSWTNDGGLENPAEVNIRGPQGETGPAGPQGETGVGERGPMGATFEDKELIDGAADLDPLQKYRVYIPMNRKSITESGIDLLPNSIFGDYPYYPYISHAVTIDNDIYYIVQCANYSAWPKLMVYRAETNEVEELITIPNYLFDPINSHMFVTDNKYITIWGLWSAMMNTATPPTIVTRDLIWYGGRCITWDVSATPITRHYVEETLVTEHISTPGIAKIDASVSKVVSDFPAPEQNYTYIFGGYDKVSKKYNTKVYAMWTAPIDGTNVRTFLVEVKDKDGKSITLDEDTYITTTAVLNNKVYLLAPGTGRMTVFNLETHTIDKKFAIGLGSDAPYNYDDQTRTYSITSTVVMNDKIYFLVDNGGKYNNCAVFDPVTERSEPVNKDDILGEVPSGKFNLSEDPSYNYKQLVDDTGNDPIHYGQRSVLPTVYINDAYYIINRFNCNPVYLELPDDMYQAYIWLTSEEFGTERIDFLDNVDFYDDVRNYFEVEICGIKINDIRTTAEIDYTFNNSPYTKPIDLPWAAGATKDISTIKLHVEHATKVLRYNTNTEYGELTGIAALDADISKLKEDVVDITADVEQLKENVANIGKTDAITDITEKLELVSIGSINIFNPDEYTLGYVTMEGTITASTALKYSEKIPVVPGDIIRFYTKDGSKIESKKPRYVTAYSANLTPIPESGLNTNENPLTEYTVPSGVSYIVVSVATAYTWMITKNTEASEYVPYEPPERYYKATPEFVGIASQHQFGLVKVWTETVDGENILHISTEV